MQSAARQEPTMCGGQGRTHGARRFGGDGVVEWSGNPLFPGFGTSGNAQPTAVALTSTLHTSADTKREQGEKEGARRLFKNTSNQCNQESKLSRPNITEDVVPHTNTDHNNTRLQVGRRTRSPEETQAGDMEKVGVEWRSFVRSMILTAALGASRFRDKEA